mmetsp:Transcript_6932/g.12760  ORF Transcript_6932/g.12760 Transcript_6932/m.12760 type:complete len:139 (+) Transcript_6932:143-559(+)
MFSNAYHKKTDDPQPDEHIPLVRLDDAGYSRGSGASNGGGSVLEQMKHVERQKEDVLDDMESAVDRLGFIATTIREEVTEQVDMLEELDTEIDEGSQKMSATMKKVTKLLGTSDRGRLGCILGLVVINVVLIFIIVFF